MELQQHHPERGGFPFSEIPNGAYGERHVKKASFQLGASDRTNAVKAGLSANHPPSSIDPPRKSVG